MGIKIFSKPSDHVSVQTWKHALSLLRLTLQSSRLIRVSSIKRDKLLINLLSKLGSEFSYLFSVFETPSVCQASSTFAGVTHTIFRLQFCSNLFTRVTSLRNYSITWREYNRIGLTNCFV